MMTLGPEHVGQDIVWQSIARKMRATIVSRPFRWEGARFVVVKTEGALRPVCMDADHLDQVAEPAPDEEEVAAGG